MYKVIIYILGTDIKSEHDMDAIPASNDSIEIDSEFYTVLNRAFYTNELLRNTVSLYVKK